MDSEDEAKASFNRNLVTRALGADARLLVDLLRGSTAHVLTHQVTPQQSLDERREVGVLGVDQRHEPTVRQFLLATVRDRDLGRALHVHAAVVRREAVNRQSLDRAARFDAADARTPAILLEGLVEGNAVPMPTDDREWTLSVKPGSG